MNTSAVVLMIIGCSILWGGLAYNIAIAIKK